MYIVFDIGGTKTRIAYSTDGVNLSTPTVKPTPKQPQDFVAMLASFVEERQQEATVDGIAGGIAGTLTPKKDTLHSGPNTEQFIGFSLCQEIEGKTGVTATIENDAALAGLAEARIGAGKEHDVVGYLTIGTGFGGARITHGVIDTTWYGFEPGKQIIDMSGEMQQAKDFLSGAAVHRERGVPPEEISDSSYWEEKTALFARAVNNALVFWSPDVLVLGGSMIVTNDDGRFGISTELTATILQDIVSFAPVPPVYYTSFGDFAVLHGALQLLTSRSA